VAGGVHHGCRRNLPPNWQAGSEYSIMGAVSRWFFGLLVLAALLFAAYTWVVLSWSYSVGERAGYVQRLSKKGWVCKTWEGELALVTMPGTVAEKFFFSVRDDAIAEQINRSIGRRVSLDYEEHMGVPSSCFGETGHYITGIKVIEGPASLSPAQVQPPSAPPSPAPAKQ
jgi:hypothetical protein